MKTSFLVVAAVMAISATPALANTPSADPFDKFANDRAVQPDPTMNGSDAYVAPFGDHLWQNGTDSLRPMNDRSRNNLQPPRMDASGVPDPRI